MKKSWLRSNRKCALGQRSPVLNRGGAELAAFEQKSWAANFSPARKFSAVSFRWGRFHYLLKFDWLILKRDSGKEL
jgi:hypothetical protein